MKKLCQNDVKKFDDFIDSLDKSNIKSQSMVILQKMQAIFGYIPKEILLETSKKTGIASSELYGVATFYHQFSFVPKGEHSMHVCLGTACYVKGSGALLQDIEDKLAIKAGEVTADGSFSVNTTRCVGACGLAPVIDIDGTIYAHVKKEQLDQIFSNLEEGDNDNRTTKV